MITSTHLVNCSLLLSQSSNGLTGTFPLETTLMKDTLVRLDLSNNLIYNPGYEHNSFLGELINLGKKAS